MSPYITSKHKNDFQQRSNLTRESFHAIFGANLTLLILVMAAMVGYVMLYNRLVSSGYSVKDLERRLLALSETQEKLDRELSELKSPESLADFVAFSGLVPAAHLNYPKQSQAFAKSGGLAVE